MITSRQLAESYEIKAYLHFNTEPNTANYFRLINDLNDGPAYEFSYTEPYFITNVHLHQSRYDYQETIYNNPEVNTSVLLFKNQQQKKIVLKLIKSEGETDAITFKKTCVNDIILTQKIYPRYKQNDFEINCYTPSSNPNSLLAKIYNIRYVMLQIMPFYEGKTFENYIKEIACDVNKLLIAIYAISKELQRIHQVLNILHGDIKLTNIMMTMDTASGWPVIQFIDMDRGYSTSGTMSYSDDKSTDLTDPYWPPERLADSEKKDVKPDFSQDIYSLGKMLISIRKIKGGYGDVIFPVFDFDWQIACLPTFYNAAIDAEPTKRPTLQSLIVALEAELKQRNIPFPNAPAKPATGLSSTATLIQAGIGIITTTQPITVPANPGPTRPPKTEKPHEVSHLDTSDDEEEYFNRLLQAASP